MVTAITDADAQAQILRNVGNDATIAAAMAALWNFRQAKALVAPDLQRLYVQRDALDSLLGRQWDAVDESDGGVSLRQNQGVTALEALRKNTEDEILLIEARTQSNRGPAVGQITTVAPISAPGPLPAFGPIDANSLDLSGNPYRRSLLWPR